MQLLNLKEIQSCIVPKLSLQQGMLIKTLCYLYNIPEILTAALCFVCNVQQINGIYC